MATNGRTTLTARTVASARSPAGKRLVVRDVGKGSVPGLELRVTPDQTKTGASGITAMPMVSAAGSLSAAIRKWAWRRLTENAPMSSAMSGMAMIRHMPASFGAVPTLSRHWPRRIRPSTLRRRRSHAEIKRILEKYWFPEIGAMRAGEVPRSKIIEVVDAIAERGAPIAANRALAMVRQVYRSGS